MRLFFKTLEQDKTDFQNLEFLKEEGGGLKLPHRQIENHFNHHKKNFEMFTS